MNKTLVKWTAVFGMTAGIIACQQDENLNPETGTTENATEFTTPDWTVRSHSHTTLPDYSVVLPSGTVNTLEIRLASGDWEKLKADANAIVGAEFGSGTAGFPIQGQIPGQVPGGNLNADLTNGTPQYFPVSMKFNGKEWYKVGFRLKGNSSLSSAWREGNYKLPFRLSFDRYEDQYPQIKNQRFYGFEKLTFSPGYSDKSLIREAVAYDLMRENGIPAPRTAFYKIYIDYDGKGLKYCGVYTAVELPEDAMVYTQYGDKRGNIYKPESAFKKNGFKESEFQKQNNEEAADYSDVKAVFAALHAGTRTANPEQWRIDLEKVFNVETFVKWLAVNTALPSWDAYGAIAHNYYLYHQPGKGLTWIPWDFNLSLSEDGGLAGMGGQIGQLPPGIELPTGFEPPTNGQFPGAMLNRAMSLDLSQGKTDEWPLIKYVAEDPVYYAKYKNYMRDFVKNFTPDAVNPKLDRYHSLISPYVVGANGEQPKYTYLTNQNDFLTELTVLKEFIRTRNQAVNAFLK